MIIEKKTVIKALKTEPLEYGFFFDFHNSDISIDEKDCPVCAVGAVIRKSLGRKINKYMSERCGGDDFNLSTYCEELTNYAYVHIDPKKLLKQKNYLGALSCYFESFSGDNEGNVTPEVEKKLIDFVRKNFPTRFKVKDFEDLKKESEKELE